MKIRTILNSLLILSLLAPFSAAQQQPPGRTPPEEVIRITTNLVQIDVIVTDKEGQQVTDLRPEEFEILESGKRQQITHFSYIAAESPAAARAAPQAAAPQDKASATPVLPAPLKREQVRRTIALVIDDLGLSFESFGFVKKALRQFVDEQMRPGDLVTILRTSTGVGAMQQFTSDKRQLHALIDRLSWNPRGRGGLNPVTALNEASAGSDFRDSAQFSEEAEQMRAGLYDVGTFGTVGSIVRGLGEMPGRKSLIFFSEAFRLFQAQGRNLQLLNAMQRLSDQANAASVAIYTVDASGLQTDTFEAADNPAARAYMFDSTYLAQSAPGETGGPVIAVNAPPRTLARSDSMSEQAERDSAAAFRRLNALMNQRTAARQESHSVLSFLAASTGGLFLNNRNDLGGAIGRIMEDQKGYYLIGYRPDESTIDSKGNRTIHRIGVKVRRSGLKVRGRSGYALFADERQRPKPRTSSEQIAAALVSPLASDDLGVRLTTLFGVEADGGSYLRSLLHLDAHDITFRKEADGTYRADLEMVAVAFGENGQAVNQLSYPQVVTADNEEAYRRLQENGISYILNFPIRKAGPYQMRVAVRDAASEKVGVGMQFVEAPDLGKNRLALSGIVLSGLEQSAAQASTGGAETDTQSGPAVRRLRRGMLLEYRYQIYSAQTDPTGRPQVQTQMRLFRDGQPVFAGRLLPLDATGQKDVRRLTAIGRLRLGPELVPGSYLLQVSVTDTLAPEKQRTATQWIDFEIIN